MQFLRPGHSRQEVVRELIGGLPLSNEGATATRGEKGDADQEAGQAIPLDQATRHWVSPFGTRQDRASRNVPHRTAREAP